ncbi:hypothetical protein SK128_025770, partial [Halocaridina rubra]
LILNLIHCPRGLGLPPHAVNVGEGLVLPLEILVGGKLLAMTLNESQAYMNE